MKTKLQDLHERMDAVSKRNKGLITESAVQKAFNKITSVYSDEVDHMDPSLEAQIIKSLIEFLNSKLRNRHEWFSKKNNGIQLNESDDKEFAEIEKIGRGVAGKCHWDGHAITKVYLEALTDANFHSERKKIAPILSKILGTEFSPI